MFWHVFELHCYNTSSCVVECFESSFNEISLVISKAFAPLKDILPFTNVITGSTRQSFDILTRIQYNEEMKNAERIVNQKYRKEGYR